MFPCELYLPVIGRFSGSFSLEVTNPLVLLTKKQTSLSDSEEWQRNIHKTVISLSTKGHPKRYLADLRLTKVA